LTAILLQGLFPKDHVEKAMAKFPNAMPVAFQMPKTALSSREFVTLDP